MDNSRRFVPAFMKNMDRQLLLNKPSVWSARTHLVLYFGLLFSIIVAAFCMLLFADSRQYESGMGTVTGFICLLAGVGLIFWFIYLLRFNVFKRYGNWENGDGIRTFLLFFLNILIIVVIPFIPSATETFMANRQFSDTEIINDMNEINLAVNNLEYERLPKKWDADSMDIIKHPYKIEGRDTIWETNTSDMISPDSVSWRGSIYDRDLPGRLISADSVLKINDSFYVFYKVRFYAYMRSYQSSNRKGAKLFTDKDIYYAVVRDHKTPDVAALTKKMEAFQKKYKRNNTYRDYYDESGAPTQPLTYNEYIVRKYKLSELNNTIDTVLDKKHNWDNGWKWMLNFLFYTTLILTMLIFIFRHTTVKTFFMSILAGVILAVITGLFVVMGRMETGVFILLTIYFFVFAAAGISTRRARTRTLLQGIGLNFFLFSLPFMPLLWVAFYYSSKHYYDLQGHVDYEQRNMNYFYAEVIGFVVLLILIEPLFKKLYRAWYAAPEE